jgi:TonB family protein
VAVVVVAAALSRAAAGRAETGARPTATKTIELDQISIETQPTPPRAFYVIEHRDSAPPRLVLTTGRAAAPADVASDYGKVATSWEAVEARRRELKALVERGRAERARLEKAAAGGPERGVPMIAERSGFVMALGSSKGLEVVRRELSGAWPELARCSSGTKREVGGQERGAVVFIVDGQGAVADARWIAAAHRGEHGACFVRRLRAMRFRGHPEVGRATYLLEVPPDREALAAARRALGDDRASSTPSVSGEGAVEPNTLADGDIDSAAVAAVMRRGIVGIRRCYESALRRDTSLQGRIVIRFVIGVAGRVARVEVLENTLTEDVGRCIAAQIAALRFPPPEGGPVTFTYPFFFQLE